MKKSKYSIVGVMSGTSLDGIDLIYAEFEFHKEWKHEIKAAETFPYSREWQEKLTQALHYTEEELSKLNEQYTRYLAEVISRFIKKNKITAPDAVCSHGHTIKHEPKKNYTLQIGNLPQIATLTGERVVCDFRVQDVKLGGQGAPLVPIGDKLLFSEYDYCLNLGGFANISTEINGKRIAYDVCPVNTVLNFYSHKLGYEYDEDGKIAASGKLNEQLLEKLNSLTFYFQQPPKSLGIEWVNKEILPVLTSSKADIPSVLHTYSVHVAQQVARSIVNNAASKVLVTGGGTFNSFLLEQFRRRSGAQFVIPPKELIDFKEALIFGLLGVLKLRGEVNVLSSVTGAAKDHSSGTIFTP